MRARDYIDVTKYEDINRGIAQPNYAGLAGMLVATVKWAGISIQRDQDHVRIKQEQLAYEQTKYGRRF